MCTGCAPNVHRACTDLAHPPARPYDPGMTDQPLRRRLATGLAAFLYGRYADLAWRTGRWEKVGFEPYEALLARGERFVMANWHGHLSMMPYAWDWDALGMTILTTDRPVAQALSRALVRQGVDAVSFDPSGRPDRALRGLIRAFRGGHCLGIAPDGPLGPARQVKPGVVQISAMTGGVIAPIAVACTRSWEAKSWDRLLLPKPFTRGCFVMADPIAPPPDTTDATVADWQAKLKAALDGAEAEAKRRLGLQAASRPYD